jgi:hypothetical protein
MNVFQLNYEARLQNWFDLRTQLEGSDIQTKCVEIDKWWQKAPLVSHHLHLLDTDAWPDPWELLVENTYCEVARAVGMCYTLSLLGEKDLEIVEASNSLGDDVILVLVDNAKYVLNYYPDTVLSNTLKDFNVKRRVDFKNLKLKI